MHPPVTIKSTCLVDSTYLYWGILYFIAERILLYVSFSEIFLGATSSVQRIRIINGYYLTAAIVWHVDSRWFRHTLIVIMHHNDILDLIGEPLFITCEFILRLVFLFICNLVILMNDHWKNGLEMSVHYVSECSFRDAFFVFSKEILEALIEYCFYLIYL